MSLSIESIKQSLIEQLIKTASVDLPYVKEHRPEDYQKTLLWVERITKALIVLQTLVQEDIDNNIGQIIEGTDLASMVLHFDFIKKRDAFCATQPDPDVDWLAQLSVQVQ